MTAPRRFVIYFNPRGTPGFARWMNYAARAEGLDYDGDRRQWLTDDDSHAATARRCGMLVAEVQVVPYEVAP